MATRRLKGKDGRLYQILSKGARTHACEHCGAHCADPTTLSIHERFCDGKQIEMPHTVRPNKPSLAERQFITQIMRETRVAGNREVIRCEIIRTR